MAETATTTGTTEAKPAEALELLWEEILKRPPLREDLRRRLAQFDDPKPGERRLRLDKAKDDVVPLVKWLLQRDPAAKLAAIVLDAVYGSDIEQSIKQSQCYDGNIGHDLWRDWQQDVVAMIESPETPPEDRAVAAWIMGAITVT